MILDIKKLLAKAQYEGEFRFDYQPEEGALLLPLCNVDGGVKVAGTYEIFEDDEVEVTLKISYKLVGSCSYCLSDASADIEYTHEALFKVGADDGESYGYDGYKLNLSAAVNDAFMFSQPKVLLCKPDCKGIKI